MKNPVCKKDMKLAVRTKKTVWGLFSFNAVLALFGLLVFYGMFGARYDYSSVDYSGMLELYVLICLIEMCLVSFIVPSITAGSIAGEREKQTLEILLTTKMTSWQIIWGKLVSSISTLLLYIISGIPILAIVFSVGGIRVLDLLEVVAYIFVLAVYFGSFGILYSCIFKKSIVATICTYATAFITAVGPFITVWFVYFCQEFQQVNGSNYVRPDVGHWAAIGLLSPIYSVASLLASQISSPRYFYDVCVQSDGFWGNLDLKIWFVLTVVVQLAISLLVLKIAAKRLNPIKKAGGKQA